MVKAVSTAEIFEQMLGDIKYSKDSIAGELYPFFVRVGVVKIRPPRHEFFEFIRDMGMLDLKRLFAGEPIAKETLTFVFPERWIGVHEAYAMMQVMVEHPNTPDFKQVDIITSSPIIVGNFVKEQVRILTWPDDDKYTFNR